MSCDSPPLTELVSLRDPAGVNVCSVVEAEPPPAATPETSAPRAPRSTLPSHGEYLLERAPRVLAQVVGEINAEVQDHVASLLGAFGQREPFAGDALLRPGLDHVSGGHGDGPAV